MKFRLINHKFKRSENMFQIVRILIDLPMLYATKTKEQWGPNLRVWRTLTRHNNHVLINSWFLSEYLIKLNDIFHKYKIELFWFNGILFVPLSRTEILHFRGISLGGRTLGTPVYLKYYLMEDSDLFQYHDCWWPGDIWSQVISRCGIDLVLPEYSVFNSVNTLRPEQNGCYFADDIFKYIIPKINFVYWFKFNWFLVKIENKSGFVHAMSYWEGDMPLTEPMVTQDLSCRSPCHNACVTEPQWVKQIWTDLWKTT